MYLLIGICCCSPILGRVPCFDGGCFPTCFLRIGGILLLLLVNIPSPSLALAMMGLVATGLWLMAEELFPDQMEDVMASSV